MPDSDQQRHEAPKPFWSGTISFGLVAVPVDLYAATRSDVAIRQRTLAPDGTALRREYVCPEHERALEPDEIVRGFELDDGRFVVVTDAELEALAPEATRNIDLVQFVPCEQLSPMLFERAYFLLPNSDSLKPYRLLAQVLEDSGRAGIASFVMRGHQHIVAILAADGLLRAETLRFLSELRTPEDIGLPPPPELFEAEAVERMRKLIAEHVAADIDLDELRDETRAQTLALVERKLAQGRDLVAPPPPEPGAEAEIIDLMDVLRRSLARPQAS